MLGFIFYDILPTATILFFNSAILRKIRKEPHISSNVEPIHRIARIRTTTRILFWIIFIFIVFSFIPRLTQNIINIFFKQLLTHWIWQLIQMMVVFNSSVNIFIYCLVGRSFRDAIFDKFLTSDVEPEAEENAQQHQVTVDNVELIGL